MQNEPDLEVKITILLANNHQSKSNKTVSNKLKYALVAILTSCSEIFLTDIYQLIKSLLFN
ncbi:MAG: hypothetical protein NTW85_00885 [Methylococcales bacterium]|jgi:hypothetical protein|nr:hypothetical protein [Methylococcales bacterium]